MSGFKISGGQDLDTVFQTRAVTDPSAQNLGYRTSDGKSLSERYLPYTVGGLGGGVKAVTTGYKVIDTSGNTTDLSDWYKKLLSWSNLTSGTNERINAIYPLNESNVYVGGYFTNAGGVPNTAYIAKWNGVTNTWSALGTGTNGVVIYIYALDVSNVYVGGNFTSAGGNTQAVKIAKWDGNGWSSLGQGISSGQGCYAIAALSVNEVYVGGYFSGVKNPNGTDVANTAYLARWNQGTNSWSSFGAPNSGVDDLYAISSSNIYVVGGFTQIGGNTCNRVALWNGSSFNALGAGVDSTGGSPNAMAYVAPNNIYVGGWFTSAGGNVPNTANIAKWNGSSWVALGTSVVGTSLNGYVQSMFAVDASNVYVVGSFTSAGGVANTAYLAKWDGHSWSAVGGGVNGGCDAVYVSNTGALYLGGLYSKVGGDTSCNSIAKYS